MPVKRRIGSQDSASRTKLLDAAARLMRDRGAGEVSVRNLAEEAGLKRQIVHYYFRSMEELFGAVVTRSSERFLAEQRKRLAEPNPVRALWEMAANPDGIHLQIEFWALSNRFDSVRDIAGDYMDRARAEQIATLSDFAKQHGGKLAGLDPAAVPLLMRGVAKVVLLEKESGAELGHPETLHMIENFVGLFDPD